MAGEGHLLSIPGEAKGLAAALRLRKIRPMAAADRQSIMSMRTI